MKKQTLAISILSLTAVILLIANMIPSPAVMAATTIKDRQYQACTATTQQGEDGVYVLDNQTGMLMVYTYDSARRQIALRASRAVTDLFPVAAPPVQRRY